MSTQETDPRRDTFWEFQKHRLESEPEDGEQFAHNWYIWQVAWNAAKTNSEATK